MKTLELLITEELQGRTLESLLRNELGLTRKQISGAKFRENGICLNGEKQRVNAKGKPGDRLSVQLEENRESFGKVLPVEGEIQILYEDEDVIVLLKPGGMPCHPGRGHYRDSLGNYLAGYLEKKGEAAKLCAVGRLDKDTSGIMVYGKNSVAAARLFGQKETGSFWKEYLAVVKGRLPKAEGRIEAPIGRVPGKKQKMQVTDQGKPAKTVYLTERKTEAFSLLRCRIFTGRTHQIRVHLAWKGCPILGDSLYGDGTNPLFQGLGLHAWKVVFDQPFTGKRITVQAEPEHWRQETWEEAGKGDSADRKKENKGELVGGKGKEKGRQILLDHGLRGAGIRRKEED